MIRSSLICGAAPENILTMVVSGIKIYLLIEISQIILKWFIDFLI